MNPPLPSPLIHREVVVNGVQLTYIERASESEPAEPPLLLLHGLIATAETMISPLAELANGHRLVALDILSASPIPSAESGAPATPLDLSFAGFANLIVAFAAEIGLERPVLLGHSHGGALALQAATAHPSVLGGLILLCPAHPFCGYNERLVSFFLTPWGRAVAHLLPLLPARLFNVSRMTGPNSTIPRRQVERYRAAFRQPRTLPRTLRLLRSWQLDMACLRKALQSAPVELPTLLFWGDSDPAVPIATAAALERYLLDSERITLAGIGHLPADEAPAAVQSSIENHRVLQGNLPPARCPRKGFPSDMLSQSTD